MTVKELLRRYRDGERDFQGVNLRDANLRDANLRGADFLGVDLSLANLIGANLSGTNLRGADLLGVDLSLANLIGANLSGAYASGASLIGADLRFADLSFADLSSAYLSDANLRDADLYDANFNGADLRNTNLIGANLIDADFDQVRFANTQMDDVDLGSIPAAVIEIESPCAVDWRTVAKSLRSPNLHQFLVRCGMPDMFAINMIETAKALDPGQLFALLQSTFISYGGPDEGFAKKLRDALHRNGVHTWFFPQNAVPGEKLHREMWRGVNEYDRVILVCSKSSLTRPGVLTEIERALEREGREGGTLRLIPIRLDDFVFSDWHPEDRPDLKQEIMDRVIADFRGTMNDDDRFTTALATLLRALKKY